MRRRSLGGCGTRGYDGYRSSIGGCARCFASAGVSSEGGPKARQFQGETSFGFLGFSVLTGVTGSGTGAGGGASVVGVGSAVALAAVGSSRALGACRPPCFVVPPRPDRGLFSGGLSSCACDACGAGEATAGQGSAGGAGAGGRGSAAMHNGGEEEADAAVLARFGEAHWASAHTTLSPSRTVSPKTAAMSTPRRRPRPGWTIAGASPTASSASFVRGFGVNVESRVPRTDHGEHGQGGFRWSLWPPSQRLRRTSSCV